MFYQRRTLNKQNVLSVFMFGRKGVMYDAQLMLGNLNLLDDSVLAVLSRSEAGLYTKGHLFLNNNGEGIRGGAQEQRKHDGLVF